MIKSIKAFMDASTTKEHVGPSAEKYSFQPGNGRRYEIYVQPISKFTMNGIGSIDNGYLIIDGATAKAFMFAAEGYLSIECVGEHLPQECFEDLVVLTAMIGYATNRDTNVDIKPLEKF